MKMFNVVDPDFGVVFSGQHRECEIWVARMEDRAGDRGLYLIQEQARIESEALRSVPLSIDTEALENEDRRPLEQISYDPEPIDLRDWFDLPPSEESKPLEPEGLSLKRRLLGRAVTMYFAVRDGLALGLLWFLLMIAPMVMCRRAGRESVQAANDLIDAGFTIVDPEGFEVSRFDDSADEKPAYLTTSPKGGER